MTINAGPHSKAAKLLPSPVFNNQLPGEHLMALSVLKGKTKAPYEGIIRVVTNRKGSVGKAEFVDRSYLSLAESSNLLEWAKTRELSIANIDQFISAYATAERTYIGLEDPDIIVDNKTGRIHVYFSIAYKLKVGYNYFLGHAEGSSLSSLTATKPVLAPMSGKPGFKELAAAPMNTLGYRLNLVESGETIDGIYYTTIDVVKAASFGSEWEFIRTELYPAKTGHEWCSGHVSPCTILPKEFITYDKSLLLAIINGRSPDTIQNGNTLYGTFRPGLILYNPETGEIPWVSPAPLLENPEATTITFASDFVCTSSGKGILYAHIDDSFIRAYELNANEILKLLPK